jgi:hypothetical protein
MSDFSVPNASPGRCCKCSGSGIYRWAGATVNGVWRGKEGVCHSCQGTGFQDKGQIARNVGYNRHKLSEMAGAMAEESREDIRERLISRSHGRTAAAHWTEDVRGPSDASGRACGCGSGKPRENITDARGIFVAYVCDDCRRDRLKGFRVDIFHDSQYPADDL